MKNLIDNFLDIATIVTAITVIGGFLIGIYKFLVVEPDNRMAQKINEQNNRALRETVEPLTEQIKILNINLDLIKMQSDETKKEVKSHDGRLDDHETRISVLENRKDY
ncbi:hypothetical protein Javan636_0007 [Streptococcus phage Javan636]|uniref:hypothetical protein n=1 Tax=Streptococcus uberis TaxID=1349 RepID=UPI0006204B16|nr:hypothetical protein [Streptococcus uberis]KKF49690.1 hypothetical protein AF60_09310 [Streptococcus uberis S6261]QBX31362.1 hypothetical protein Javan636_0007 [Streptococcus phage Javan636]